MSCACSPNADGDSSQLSKIYAQLEAIEADKAPAKAAVILNGLGFTPFMQAMPTKWVDIYRYTYHSITLLIATICDRNYWVSSKAPPKGVTIW